VLFAVRMEVGSELEMEAVLDIKLNSTIIIILLNENAVQKYLPFSVRFEFLPFNLFLCSHHLTECFITLSTAAPSRQADISRYVL